VTLTIPAPRGGGNERVRSASLQAAIAD
jgi:hypothetical protein